MEDVPLGAIACSTVEVTFLAILVLSLQYDVLLHHSITERHRVLMSVALNTVVSAVSRRCDNSERTTAATETWLWQVCGVLESASYGIATESK